MLSTLLTLSDLGLGFLQSWVNFAVVSIASAQVSLIVTYIKMPLIIGYMAFGLLFGPQVCGLVSAADLPNLQYITQFALAFICLSAGAELYLPELKLLFRRILIITGLITAITFIVVLLVVYAESQGGLTQYTSVLPEGISQNGCQFSIAMIAAAIMVSQSPASAIAVVREVRAKGTFTSTMLGVTVLIDVVVLLLASIATSIANSECDPNSDGFSVIDLILTIATVISAVFIGWIVGKIIIFLIWLPRVPGEWAVPWLGFGVFQFSTWFLEYTTEVWGHGVNLDALLICIAAGYVVANQSRNRRKFLRFFNKAGPIIFIPFFTLTGAGLKLNVLTQPATIAFAVVTSLARAASFAAACIIGGYYTGMDAKQRNTLWIAMITQAGVSLGIAAEVALAFPEWGGAFQSVIIAVILINQVLGPILCAKVLDYNEETGKAEADEDEDEVVKRCVLFGMTDESFALAQRLLRANWDVVFLDTDEERLSMTRSLIVPVRRKHSHAEEEVPHVDVSKVEGISTVRETVSPVVEEEKLEADGHGEVELSQHREGESDSAELAADGHAVGHPTTSSETYVEVETVERVTTRLIKPVALTKLKSDPFALTASGSSRAKDAKLKALIAGYEEALLELTDPKKPLDAAVLCLASDSQSFSLANLLLDTMHVRKVIAQVNNPNWATMFASIGVLTVYSFSSTVAMLFQCVVALNNKLAIVNERKPLHTQLADHIIHPDTTPTVPVHLTYSEDSDQADYLRLHPNPPIRPEQLFKFNERVKVVSEAERSRYVDSIWGVHEARSGIDLTGNLARAGLTFSGPMMVGEDEDEQRDESEARAAMDELDNVDWEAEERKEVQRSGGRGRSSDEDD